MFTSPTSSRTNPLPVATATRSGSAASDPYPGDPSTNRPQTAVRTQVYRAPDHRYGQRGDDAVETIRWPLLAAQVPPPPLPEAPVGSMGRADWLQPSDPGTTQRSAASQARYEAMFWTCTRDLAQRLQQGIRNHGSDELPRSTAPSVAGIMPLWEGAMEARRRIGDACGEAIDVSLRDWSDYRMQMRTPMAGRYEPQVRAIIDSLLVAPGPPTDDHAVTRESTRNTGRANSVEMPSIDLHRVAVSLLGPFGRRIALTETVLPVASGMPPRFGRPAFDDSKMMLHTDPTNIPQLMVRAHHRAAAALDPSTSPHDARQHVASFMWTLYHACPSTRGSAAMTDMCANALYLARGDVPHTWPKGVVGDLEALLRDEPTWMEHYLQIGFGQTSIPEETRARFEEASLRRSLDASLAGGSHRGASTRS